ncbi:uncharacterized protein LOC116616625 [Nematostella vectensis]|uniref:uncharacterized protein LOC116616625 n=1 Tax=Nematostella vectensis TaxID=45351 RepID=UPI00207711D9|nr:uncharacterized protein LOC116616625 [Nematostella vectensis]
MIRILALLFCCMILNTVEGSPSKCKDGQFLDVQNQLYIACDECEDDWMGCSNCCKPATDAPNTIADIPIASAEDAESQDRRVLKTFLYGFVLFVIASVLFVLLAVVIKVTRERRAQCDVEARDRNASNATDICEVYYPPATNADDLASGSQEKSKTGILSGAVNLACDGEDGLPVSDKSQTSKL